MLNISSTAAVSWPTPVAPGVAPVTPVAAVQPAQASGGTDEGAPGLRPHGPAFYAAYDRDPDGNKLSAVHEGTA